MLFFMTPYVRFARIQTLPLRRYFVVPLDHRIFYCVQGSGEITVKEQTYTMTPGRFLMIRAGTPYQNTSADNTMALYAFNFDLYGKQETMGAPISYVKAELFQPSMLVEEKTLWEEQTLPDVLSLADFYKKEIFEEIIHEYNHKEKFYQERCGALIKDIMICAIRARETETAAPSKTKGAEILSYIRGHFSEPLTNADIAKHFSYHENYVNQLLKKQTGQTLHQYLLEYRIQIAIYLLQSGEYTVSEVAAAVGIHELSHFAKCFKKITGVSPSAYRPSWKGNKRK